MMCKMFTLTSITNVRCIFLLWLAMHSLAAVGRPRLSETEFKWFVFETSCYAFCGRYCIESVGLRKWTWMQLTFFYCIDVHFYYNWQFVNLHRLIAQLGDQRQRTYWMAKVAPGQGATTHCIQSNDNKNTLSDSCSCLELRSVNDIALNSSLHRSRRE